MFILLISIMQIIPVISLFVEVCVDLGIADHVWQAKCAAIAATVYALGDNFKPDSRAGWLAYIRDTYPDEAGAAAAAPSVGEDAFVQSD